MSLCITTNTTKISRYIEGFAKLAMENKLPIAVFDNTLSFAANGEFLAELRKHHNLQIYHYDRSNLRKTIAEISSLSGCDASPLFQQKTISSGRNLSLLFALGRNEHAVISDDDATPFDGFFFQKHADALSSYGIGHGAIAGNIGMYLQLLLQIQDELFEIKRGNRKGSELEESRQFMSGAIRGVQRFSKTPCLMGLSANNMSVRKELASKVPFACTPFNIEDYVYSASSRMKFPEFNYMQNPKSREEENELIAKLPAVFHNREPTEKPTIFPQLIKELKGSVAARMLQSTILQKNRIPMPRSLELAISDTYTTFAMEKFKRAFKFLESTIAQAGVDGLDAEISKITAIEPADFTLSDSEAADLLRDFNHSLENWEKVTSSAAARFSKELVGAPI